MTNLTLGYGLRLLSFCCFEDLLRERPGAQNNNKLRDFNSRKQYANHADVHLAMS